jgi:hypothetical protein
MTHHVKPEFKLELCPARLVLSLKSHFGTHICRLGAAE